MRVENGSTAALYGYQPYGKNNSITKKMSPAFGKELPKTGRAAQVCAGAPVPAMPDFSKMSDSQKLSALRKLHEQTDYSGMTDVEKYRLMNDRFEAAFPKLHAYLNGVFGQSGLMQGALPRRIMDEREHQWKDLGLKQEGKLHAKAYYSGLTREETHAAIMQKYSGGTIADRAGALRELHLLGLDNGDAFTSVRRMQIFQSVTPEGLKIYINDPKRADELSGAAGPSPGPDALNRLSEETAKQLHAFVRGDLLEQLLDVSEEE